MLGKHRNRKRKRPPPPKRRLRSQRVFQIHPRTTQLQAISTDLPAAFKMNPSIQTFIMMKTRASGR
jgi:hypothetical protein